MLVTGGIQDAYILSNSDAFAKEQPAMLVASAERFCLKTSSSSDFTESSISSTVIPDQAISWGWTECKAKFITIGLVEPVQWWTTASTPLGGTIAQLVGC